MDIKKINYRQPKYVLPAIIFLPLVFMAYNICEFVGDSNGQQGMVTDSLNVNMPEANIDNTTNRYDALRNQYFGKDNESALEKVEGEDLGPDTIESAYSKEELELLRKQMEMREEQEMRKRELQNRIGMTRDRFNDRSSTSATRNEELQRYAKDLQDIQRKANAPYEERMARAENEELKEKLQKMEEREKLRQEAEKKKEAEKPEIVQKVQGMNADVFHSVGKEDVVDNTLIKAMVDQTTKVHEGTRVRFKLLDDVIIQDYRLKKGTYLYGLVSGFGNQRVMVDITSVMIKDQFININLSVFDNDGMQGFYVPESTFRQMMKEASAGAVRQNVQFYTGGTSELDAETMALQALQNVYQSTSQAIAGNLRKNKARIKYNTIVYLINTKRKETAQQGAAGYPY